MNVSHGPDGSRCACVSPCAGDLPTTRRRGREYNIILNMKLLDLPANIACRVRGTIRVGAGACACVRVCAARVGGRAALECRPVLAGTSWYTPGGACVAYKQ